MRPLLTLLFLSLVFAALLTSGCTGAGRQELNITAVPTGRYSLEFGLGYEHHTTASGLFDEAALLWNADDLSNASARLSQAQSEYALATAHYHNMLAYAETDADRAFAEGLESTAIDMAEATARYLLSLDASMAGNSTDALTYFNEGQALADAGMGSLNRSLEIMPERLCK